MRMTKLLCTLLIVVSMGCEKDGPDPRDIDNGNPPVPLPKEGLATTVAFPEEVSADYTEYKLFSLGEEAELDASGKATVAHDKDQTNIAWLFDKDDNLVMAGLVNEGSTAIDAASTAKVLLYYTFAVPMLPKEVQQAFFRDIGSVTGVPEWELAFAEILKNDRLTLDTGSYLDALHAAVEGMGGTNDLKGSTTLEKGTSDPGAKKLSDITVIDGGQQKSGLLVGSDVLSKITITNQYRRRAHAFFYKARSKDVNGNQREHLSEIGEATAADREEALDPVASINSFTGVVANWIEGKAMEFAAKETDPPLDFPLEDEESEATYWARIVGPGQWQAGKMLSKAEQNKLARLEIETVAMDFLIPAFATLLSSTIDAKPGANATDREREFYGNMVEGLVPVVEEMIKGIPGVYDEMKKGNYAAATGKVLEAVYAGNLGIVKDGFVKVMAILARNIVDQGFYVSPQYDEINAQKRMMEILELADVLLQGSDYFRMAYGMSKSKFLEEWDLQLMGGKVTLAFVQGSDSLLNTADETKIEALIKNIGDLGEQHPYFEWKTSGKYGKLVDTKGHSGTEFDTSDAIVSYQSTVNSSDLSDGDNIDSIYVRASFNNMLIGMDTILVNVKKSAYEMKPVDGVVTGRKHGNAAHNVTLHLEKVVTGVRDIPNHETLDFMVEWSTEGIHGELQGETTTYNDDDIVYTATSDAPGIFSETITARISIRNKGETDYFLFGTAKAEVEIDNDPKKKIIWAGMTNFHGHSNQPWTSGNTLYFCILQNGVTFDQDADAESYSLVFLDMKKVIGAPTGHSWIAGEPSPYAPHETTETPGNSGTQYSVVYAWGSRNSYDDSHVEDPNGFLAQVGGARITITLK